MAVAVGVLVLGYGVLLYVFGEVGKASSGEATYAGEITKYLLAPLTIILVFNLAKLADKLETAKAQARFDADIDKLLAGLSPDCPFYVPDVPTGAEDDFDDGIDIGEWEIKQPPERIESSTAQKRLPKPDTAVSLATPTASEAVTHLLHAIADMQAKAASQRFTERAAFQLELLEMQSELIDIKTRGTFNSQRDKLIKITTRLKQMENFLNRNG
jgi:hypothetical protein